MNDVAGHGVGDTVLKRFAAILSSGRRGNDMVARLGATSLRFCLPEFVPVTWAEFWTVW